ncbi:hypothetical protein A3D05_04550 [Candidatus Gottesmanbacteria bacterium RIFCSPHIGHO2_02_FULL_40_24]|uniref:Polysaccharide biosynthesis protein C-terminal domain-containing protein n=1 Tax=Candidatus Gottesmanbacteria bacterium RIFCSPHIGHO2_01_FULL_40_15 TaxID=1798376 RepID=A0A1F5Z1W6_9BACT|nr:MAG: hypothetical protein A2777_05580 [Candidatus Gottesmanbacteria bacterium RIFCSPHIGHO2_01_FULL_40_15]OGG16140.1 MAG: hypothetical protein A3D05_04550 [Candidatus Gottesmanbacteria bacterium RIFCSPHIGHO2_02_FULL_40_24]OGG20851.1 MAG: hypothetical protein A3B48_06580 [Candidatus Gottesmanbacteria bacterium RIFCSPLOWO2_01_FULL_40_10]OGG25810.1 MAG: hypothetical protein A3E42_05820 [Candidatus Gottesmanbacteria bacterium RIFCSPHIGHO2_12_FULL_40_13]OGG32880.1 MAG: hypothetical protein A3I80_0
MDQGALEAFKNKVVGGVLALTTRTFILQIISFTATFILTILLSPEIFGIFFVVSAVISFLTYFSDIGLAAALIQKKDEPVRSELVSVFTLQQVIVTLVVAVSFLNVSLISRFYKLSGDGTFLFQALLVSFFLSSLKTIPSILLERKLDFSLLVVPQILENLAFYLTAVILALLNLGIASFAWAALIRGIVGLIAIYSVSPWVPGLGFSYSSVRHLITFGIPFQANSLLALVKDDLLTLYLGKILPFSFIGYLGWAKKWAEIPLRLIMDSAVRVTFPAFSRIQKETALLKKAIDKTVFFLALLILPVSVLLIVYIKPAIGIIPKYQKWEPALPAFYLFSLSAVLASFSSPIVNALNALGKIRKTLGLMLLWTVMTWMLVPVLTNLIGYNGWPISALLISSTLFLPVSMLKKYVSFDFWKNLKTPLVLTLVMFLFSFMTMSFVYNIYTLVALISASLLLYLLLCFYFLKKDILPFLPEFLKRV